MAGREGKGSAGRSHRRNSAGTWASQIRQEQQPNLVEPPRWFTARRNLVKFKSAFKTGLARCPAPPRAATAGKRYRRAPTGVYRSNILGKLWMDFPPRITASSESSLLFLSLSPSQPSAKPCSLPTGRERGGGGSRRTLPTELSQRWPVKISEARKPVPSRPTAALPFRNSKLIPPSSPVRPPIPEDLAGYRQRFELSGREYSLSSLDALITPIKYSNTLQCIIHRSASFSSPCLSRASLENFQKRGRRERRGREYSRLIIETFLRRDIPLKRKCNLTPWLLRLLLHPLRPSLDKG